MSERAVSYATPSCGLTPAQRAKIDAQLDAQDHECAAGMHPKAGRTAVGGVERCGRCGRRIRA